MSKKTSITSIIPTIASLLALDAMLDTAVFGKPLGLFGELADEEDLKKVNDLLNGTAEPTDTKPTLVGKKYKVNDCSYSTNKTFGTDACGLHDMVGVITADPYKDDVTERSFLHRDGDERKYATMVDIKSEQSGLEYSVLFEENCVIGEDGKCPREVAEEKRLLLGF